MSTVLPKQPLLPGESWRTIMLFIAIIAVLVAVLLGLVAKFVLHRLQIPNIYNETHAIGWAEFVVVGLVMTFVFTPLVLLVGKHISVANIVTYEQFLNGVETKAVDDVTKCYAGQSGESESAGQSNCRYVYDSGDYSWTTIEQESYSCTGADGKSTTCYRPKLVTHWADIYTPYATVEHHYSIRSSFGFKENDPYHFGGTYLDADPKPYGKKSIPGDLPRGAPEDWLDAKEHLERDDPRPITTVDKYDNYILASDQDVLKSYSKDISHFKEAGLLPDHTAKIMSDPVGGPSNSQAKKLSFLDVDVSDEQQWQESLMRFNAALGMKLQGDLHVVFVDAAQVTSQEAVPYLNALKAYWQGPAFKKRALAKNGIILAVGVSDNSIIEWAEASTGMPFGNELLTQYVRDYLPGSAFNPRELFGEPRTVITGDNVDVTLSSPRGTLEEIVFESAPFARASMSCEDKGESCVGFKDLLDTIEPTSGQKTVMVLVTTFLAIILWLIVGFTSFVGAGIASVTGRTRSSLTAEYDNLYTDPYDLTSRNRGRRNFKKEKRNEYF